MNLSPNNDKKIKEIGIFIEKHYKFLICPREKLFLMFNNFWPHDSGYSLFYEEFLIQFGKSKVIKGYLTINYEFIDDMNHFHIYLLQILYSKSQKSNCQLKIMETISYFRGAKTFMQNLMHEIKLFPCVKTFRA